VPGLLQPLFGLFVRLKPHRVSLERPSSLPGDCVWGGFVLRTESMAVVPHYVRLFESLRLSSSMWR
jgi:hypothetical protein